MASKVVARGYFDAIGDSSIGLLCQDESLAVQASRDEVDINTIVNKYLRTGELPVQRQVIYADISEMGDLQACLERVSAAEEAFAQLPARIRRYFDNDPVRLVEFAADPANTEKAIELGLALPKPVPPRQPAPVDALAAAPAPSKEGA